MHAKKIESASEWENFLHTQKFTPFVQSPKYIEFYKNLKEDGFVVGVYDHDTLVGGSVVVTTHAKRGNFLYLPYGPLLPADHSAQMFACLIEFLKHYGKQHGYVFIRVSPFVDDTPDNKKLFSSIGFRPAPMHVLAENTWLLDITPDEETLLKAMNKNHRNLIRRCERDGVTIQVTTDPQKLSGLNSLLDITAKRHKFRRFSEQYIAEEFKSFLPHSVMLFEAFLPDGSLDSAAVIMFYGTMAAYRHSASLGKNPKLPSSYLLQWHVIQEAKKRGMKLYNFWGIAPEQATQDHPFFGITHFKKGFGGFKKDVLHCQDLPLSHKYWINWCIETFRRFKRGF